MSPSTERQQYRQLVAEVAARAKERLPQEVNGRLESAVKLVLAGDVEPQGDGSIRVGGSDPTRYYILTGHACTCTDFVQGKAPDGWCKHRISAGIAKRVAELMPQEPAPAAALPEAPASCNVYVTISGHTVQVTLRDHDEQRMLARLQTLLAQYPAPAAPAPEATTTRECPIHNVLMVEQHNARGAWWSHRQTDGSWCKGK